MIRKIHSYLLVHGMTLMVIGFAVAASGLLAYIYNLNNLHSFAFGRAAHTATFTGFGLYLVGRIYVVLKKRRDKAAGERKTIAEDVES